jgi:hypothetical protein
MLRRSLHHILVLLAAICLAAMAVAPASAQTSRGAPAAASAPANNYIAASDDKEALDCYFDAVPHLYDVQARQVHRDHRVRL